MSDPASDPPVEPEPHPRAEPEPEPDTAAADQPGLACGPGHGRPGLPALPVTFRPTRTRVVLLVAGGVMFAVLTLVVMALPTLSPAERLSFVFAGLLFLGVPVLLSRPRVTAERGGVTVVNLTSRRRLEWAEILQVNLRAGDPWVYLDLADGTSWPALGIQPGIAKEQAIRDARALRALVEAYGTGDPAR